VSVIIASAVNISNRLLKNIIALSFRIEYFD